jgi:hypothetical protein
VFFYENPNFGAGDAEYFYNMVRLHKPKRIVEIGSEMSTMLAQEALTALRKTYSAYLCKHICFNRYG